MKKIEKLFNVSFDYLIFLFTEFLQYVVETPGMIYDVW